METRVAGRIGLREQANGERGAGRTGFFLTLALFSLFVYMAIKFVPVYVNAYIFEDTLREEAKFASVTRDLSEAQLKNRILAKAQDLELPVSAAELSIKRTQTMILIQATYMVPIETAFFTYEWSFSQEGSSPVIF
jgi:hypothetical protein